GTFEGADVGVPSAVGVVTLENRLLKSVEIFIWFNGPDSSFIFRDMSPDLPVGETRRQGGIIDNEFFDATDNERVVCDKSENVEIELVA
ncbi:hypothetical protein F25303_11138, partial [Fusarium sp. NRRL 25303]